VETAEKQWSPVGLLLLFWGGAIAAAAYGLINARWGWVILAAGMALMGLTHAMNIRTVRGSITRFMSVTYEDWGPWSLRLNTVGNVLTVIGVLVIWAQ